MELHVRSAGDEGAAGTILFLHGFPFDGSIWDDQMAALPPGWRGLAPDLRGFGRSPLGAAELPSGGKAGAGVALPDEAVLTMASLAEDVAGLVEEQVGGPVVVCGLSMGGYVAFALLRSHPELVRALVLMDTRAGPDNDEGRENRRRVAASVREHGSRPLASSMLPTLFAPRSLEERGETAERVQAMMEQASPRTLIAALAGMAARPDSNPDLAGIRVPTLVLVGAEDSITPPDAARAMATAIPHARLEVVAGAGHLACVEAPETTNRLLASFLQQL